MSIAGAWAVVQVPVLKWTLSLFLIFNFVFSKCITLLLSKSCLLCVCLPYEMKRMNYMPNVPEACDR